MRSLFFIAAIAIAPLAACSKSEKSDSAKKEEVEHVTDISIADVEAGIAAKSITLFDCNSEKTRKKVGILPGAVLVDEETFTEKDLPADKAAKLVFYCGGPG